MQGEEPATGLVYSLVDEVAREGDTLIDQVLILEGIVNLSVRHGTRIEPNVNQVALALHGFTTLRDEHDIVDVWTVKVDLVVVLLRHIARHETIVLQRVRGHKASLDSLLYLVIEFLY